MTERSVPRLVAAQRSQRIKARLSTVGIVLAAYLAGLVLLLLMGDSTIGVGLQFAVLAVLFGWILWLMLARAQTPGYLLTGLVAVDPATGQPVGGKLFIRNLLQGLVSSVTCGLAEPIVSYTTFDGRTTWFDRTVGIHVVQSATLGHGVPPAARVPPGTRLAPGGVTPVVPAATRPVQPVDDRTELIDRVGGGSGIGEVSGARPGWEPVASEHVPIQTVPGHMPNPPGPTSQPEAAQGESPEAAHPVAVPEPAQAVASNAEPGASGGDFIAGVPWRQSPPGSAEPVPASALPTPPESFSTVAIPQRVTPEQAVVTPHIAPRGPGEPEPVELVAAGADRTVADASPFRAIEVPVLRFDDGEEHPLSPAMVIGRAPVPPASHPDARPLAVTDPAMKVSKTHLLVAFDGSSVVVTDLASTNGVRVAREGQGPRRLTPWVPHALQAGERVLVGSRSFEVIAR